MDSSKDRQSRIIDCLQSRRIYKNHIIDLANKLVDQFTFLEQAKSKAIKSKGEND